MNCGSCLDTGAIKFEIADTARRSGPQRTINAGRPGVGKSTKCLIDCGSKRWSRRLCLIVFLPLQIELKSSVQLSISCTIRCPSSAFLNFHISIICVQKRQTVRYKTEYLFVDSEDWGAREKNGMTHTTHMADEEERLGCTGVVNGYTILTTLKILRVTYSNQATQSSSPAMPRCDGYFREMLSFKSHFLLACTRQRLLFAEPAFHDKSLKQSPVSSRSSTTAVQHCTGWSTGTS